MNQILPKLMMVGQKMKLRKTLGCFEKEGSKYFIYGNWRERCPLCITKQTLIML